MNENQLNNPRTIESELPEAKYITKYRKKVENYDGTIDLDLIVELHGAYTHYEKLQETLIQNNIAINDIEQETSFWSGAEIKRYSGESTNSGKYILTSHTKNYKEKIILTVHSYKGHATKIPDLVNVVKTYIIEYENSKKPKPVATKITTDDV